MTKTFVCMVTAALLAASGAFAGERPLDAGLGGVSGAVFLGPVGAIAGGVIGYTKGPGHFAHYGPQRTPSPPRAVFQEEPVVPLFNQPSPTVIADAGTATFR